MFGIRFFTNSILAAAMFFGAHQSAMSAGESSVEKLYREHGIRFSDTHACTIKWNSGESCKSFVLSEVQEDSEAFLAGLRPGHVSTLFPQHIQRTNKSLEKYADDVLYNMPRQRFEATIRCEFNDLLTAFQGGGSHKETTCNHRNGAPFMLGRALAETHIGIKIDDKGVVTSILEPSPASVAGVKIGDRLQQAVGPSDELSDNLFWLGILLRNVANKGQRTFFQRDGEPVEIRMPRVPFGKVVDPALAQTELTAEESEVFEELPKIIRPFFAAVYGGRFVRAEFEKKAFYLKAYSASLAAQIGETSFGEAVTAKYDRLVSASRFGPLLAQYALVKLNTVGNCGMPVKTIPYTETLVRTISDGYGVPLSQTVVSQSGKSFDIDARFAPFVESANQVSPRPRWSTNIRNFIGSSGGCGSQILEQLEKNMLEYQQH